MSKIGEEEIKSQDLDSQQLNQQYDEVTTADDRDDESDSASRLTVSDANIDNNSTINNTRRNMIIYYGKEFICLVAIVLTTLASSYQGTPKIGRSPAPRQFFRAGSLVSDFPSGNLDALSQRVAISELSFVLYYAPWCATSQSVRQPYNDVARFYYREAYFSAINCWQPGSECRIQYSKIKSWPVLMAYLPKTGLAVLYNGAWMRDPMMRFVNSLIHPLKRLTQPDELLKVMATRDTVVVAFLDMQTDVREWNVFFETAIKWLFRDPFQELQFCLVTGESRRNFGVENTPTLRYYLWNETLEYHNRTWSPTDIESWLAKEMQKTALWMTPSGFKSNSMAYYLKQGPALIFFTPRNLLQESTDAAEMMRQLGMTYYNCGQDNWIREMSQQYIPNQRIEQYDSFRKRQKECENVMGFFSRSEAALGKRNKSPRSVSVTFGNLINGSSQLNLLQSKSDLMDDICEIESGSFFSRLKQENKCDNEPTCEKMEEPLMETSMLRNTFDKRSPEILKQIQFQRDCEAMSLSLESRPEFFFAKKSIEKEESIEGLACKSNKTLSFLLMDSSTYHVFAEGLGIDVLNSKQNSAVVIVDPEHESTHLLNPTDEPISAESVSRFVRKYSNEQLRRYMRSSNTEYHHTHFYKSESKTENIISIKEVNSKNFSKIVLNNSSNKTVLVHFYSSNCAFCSPMSQHLLQISNILGPLSNYLTIVRIDGDKNDLPWQYSMEEYPTLVIFPRGRKSESRRFPISKHNPVTLDNLLGFIIANLDRPLRISTIQLACKASRKSSKTLVNCLNTLRNEINENISFSLKQWRRSSQSRELILRRLQLLEELYLETFRINAHSSKCQSCDFNKLESYCVRIVKLWSSL